MSVLLRCREISKSFGLDTLFEGFNFTVSAEDRIGIIGPNGAGKSTLLKMLAGMERPDEGDIVPRKGLKVSYVPQMAEFDGEQSALQIVRDAGASGGVAPEDLDAEAHVALGRVGFTDPEVKLGNLSGGWRKRLTLACGILGNPDLVLLDEPTNHLDTRGVLWLEDLMKNAPWAWVLVTHDRIFLERSARHVTEVNRIFPDGCLTVKGGYRRFHEERAAFLQQQETYREALANKARRESEWLSRQPKARTTKARFRVDAAYELMNELEQVSSRARERKTRIAFSASERKTKKLIEVKGLTKSYGEKLIVKDLDLVLSPGNRTGLLGVNGSGKTTLLRLILGDLVPDDGTVRHAPDLRCVYFDQIRQQLNPQDPLRLALSEKGDSVLYRGQSIHVIAWAKRFRFNVDQLPLPVGTLSGGEQARVLIARLMLQQADILVLDEPTNDLDIPTLEILEESLIDFPGALVLVTHDRYMLERVCNRFIGLDGMGNCFNYGGYEQWEQSLLPKSTKKKTVPNEKPRPKKQSKKLSYKEQLEFDTMEETILAAEEELERCQEAANDPAIASDGAALIAAHDALHKAQAEVERLYDRWTELSEKIG
ncbi:MAG: ABC-F family ATP-binding cassette domain-containing protein [Acidobacteriota bacterium]|nr:ABC-F family ATP-binding cassette domain-containing protein [Acidobacteriota bacterium]